MFAYDLDGNLTQDGRWNYTWDGENRLVAMETRWTPAQVPGLPQLRLEFSYDGLSRRVTKTVKRKNAAGTWAIEQRLRFAYDRWNLIAEEDVTGAAPVLIRSYQWSSDLSGTRHDAGGVGGLVMITLHSADGTSQSFYPCYDGNGNITALLDVTNAQAGVSVAAQYEYGPFGEALRATGRMATSNPFAFSTKYQDRETRLNYYGYRYYDAYTSRWLSRDPIEEAGGDNLFAFTLNAPTNGVDFLGLAGYKLGSTDPSISPDPGAGQHDSKSPTPQMQVLKAILQAPGVFSGWPNAKAHLGHYLGNTGAEYTVKLQEMIDDVPSAKDLFNRELSEAQRFVEADKYFQSGSLSITSGRASTGRNEKSQSADWYYAVGGYRAWGKGTVTCAARDHFTMKFEYKFFDRYNWDTGKSVTINVRGQSVTINDWFMGEFHRMGLAKEFNMKGSVHKVVKWQRGGAPIITDPPNSQGGNGGGR